MNRKASTLISLGVSAILVALGVWFLYSHTIGFWPQSGRWLMGHHSIMGGGMGIIMIIFWLLIIGALALLVSGVVNVTRGRGQRGREQYEPLEILKQRYVRGEIDKAEYEEKRRALASRKLFIKAN